LPQLLRWAWPELRKHLEKSLDGSIQIALLAGMKLYQRRDNRNHSFGGNFATMKEIIAGIWFVVR